MVALVGASGSGKTTIMNILLRFYEPQDGEIFIDGRDIRAMTLKSLREQIGLVTQDVFLFNDTIHNNIAYGRKRYSPEDIHQAAAMARAADFIADCRCNTIQWSVNAASSFPTASASVFPSPGPC